MQCIKLYNLLNKNPSQEPPWTKFKQPSNNVAVLPQILTTNNKIVTVTLLYPTNQSKLRRERIQIHSVPTSRTTDHIFASATQSLQLKEFSPNQHTCRRLTFCSGEEVRPRHRLLWGVKRASDVDSIGTTWGMHACIAFCLACVALYVGRWACHALHFDRLENMHCFSAKIVESCIALRLGSCQIQ